jgi:hypothetical protein
MIRQLSLNRDRCIRRRVGAGRRDGKGGGGRPGNQAIRLRGGGPLAAGDGEPAAGAAEAFAGRGGVGLLDTLHDAGLRVLGNPAVR